MAALDRTAALPPELLAGVFEELDFAELQPIMRVCRLWRETAVESVEYWRHITLDSLRYGSVCTFFLRLGKAGDRPIRLNVSVASPNSEFIEAMIFRTIAHHLHHIEALYVTVAADLGDALFNSLLGAADLLVHLRILLVPNGPYMSPPVLRSDILAGRPGALRSVYLYGVQLQDDEPPAAFSRVTSVWVRMKTEPVLHRIPVHLAFPGARMLSLTGTAYAQYPYTCGLRKPGLTDLHLNGPYDALQRIFADMGMQDVPHVTIHACPDDLMEEFLAAMPSGDLQVYFRDDRETVADAFTICVGDLCWAVSRSFAERQSFWSAAQTHVLSQTGIFRRVVRVTVPTHFWDEKMHLFDSLTRIAELRIIMGEDSQLPSRSPVTFPSLRRLILRSRGAVIVRILCTDLGQFNRTALVGAKLPILLTLKNVRLHGHSGEPCAECSCLIDASYAEIWSPPLDLVNSGVFAFPRRRFRS